MNNRNTISNLWNEISKLIDNKTSNLKFDKTFKTTIWKVNEDNTYSINYKGQLYNVPSAVGTLTLGQSVWVKIPSGILRNMHIYGVPIGIGSGESSGGGSSSDSDEGGSGVNDSFKFDMGYFTDTQTYSYYDCGYFS